MHYCELNVYHYNLFLGMKITPGLWGYAFIWESWTDTLNAKFHYQLVAQLLSSTNVLFFQLMMQHTFANQYDY